MAKSKNKLFYRVLSGILSIVILIALCPVTYVTAVAGSNAVNVAPNATIEAETPGWVPDWMKWPMLIDGNKNDGCYSSEYTDNQNTEKQLVFVFGGYYKFSQIILYPRVQDHHNGFPQEFKIEVSSDAGETWVQVATGTAAQDENGHVAEPVTVNLEATTGNRVRITATKLGNADDATHYALQLAEVEIMGETAEAPGTDEPGTDEPGTDEPGTDEPAATENVAPNATINAENPGWVADWMKWPMLIDGNKADGFYTSEFETSADVTKIIQFNFERTYKIDRVVLYPAKDNGSFAGFPVDFTVRVWNGTSWVVVATEENASASEAFEIEFEAMEGNAVCIIATKLGQVSGGKYALMLAEMEIYGTETATQLNPAEDAEAPGTDEPGTDEPGTDESGTDEPGTGESGATENIASYATINAETPGWVVDWMKWPMLIDGNKVDGFYTSEFETSANVTKVIQFDFERTYKIERIVLYPAKDNGSFAGFPVDFTVSVWNGTGWVVVATEENASASGAFEIEFEAMEGNAVCVKATKLGQVSGGKYALMLAEMEIYGIETETQLNPAEDAEAPGTDEPGTDVPGTDEPGTDEPGTTENVASVGKIEAETPGWVADWMKWPMLIDGNKADGFYTSEFETSADVTKIIQFNFEKTYKIERIVLYPAKENGSFVGFPVDFTVCVWNGTSWVVVATEQNASASGAFEIEFEAMEGNAVCIIATKLGQESGGKYALMLAEMEIYGTETATQLNPAGDAEAPGTDEPGTDVPGTDEPGTDEPGATENVAPVGAIEVETPGWVADWMKWPMLIDGNTNDGFYTSEFETSADVTKIIQFNFEKTYKIDRVVLYPAKDNGSFVGFPVDFTVRVWNGTSWVVVATEENASASEAFEIEFEAMEGNAVSIIVTKLGQESGGKYALMLAEMKIYGAETNHTLPAAPAAGVGDNAGAGDNEPLFDSSLNVAEGCPVDVSSDYRQYSCNRENLTDGNENTFWATNATKYKPGKDEWAEINLLQNYKINKIILLARPDGWGFPIDFTISIFYDGKWTEVLNVKDFQSIENAGRVTAYEFDIPETIGNKIRLTSNRYRDAGVDKVICLNEIVVYGTKYENGILPNDNLVAINSQVTTSSSVEDYAYYRQNLSDGNNQSEWSSVTTSHENEEVWIQVDFFCEFPVSEIQLKPAWGGHGFPVNFSIQVCENGEWVTVYTAENYEKPVDEAIQRFRFEQRNITAFRVVVNKMECFGGLYSVKLAEVMAYRVQSGDDFDPDALQGENSTQTNFPNSSKDVLYDEKGNVIDAEGNVLIPANLLKGGSGWTVAILVVGIVLILVSAGGIFWVCRKRRIKQ